MFLNILLRIMFSSCWVFFKFFFGFILLYIFIRLEFSFGFVDSRFLIEVALMVVLFFLLLFKLKLSVLALILWFFFIFIYLVDNILGNVFGLWLFGSLKDIDGELSVGKSLELLVFFYVRLGFLRCVWFESGELEGVFIEEWIEEEREDWFVFFRVFKVEFRVLLESVIFWIEINDFWGIFGLLA